MYAGPKGGGSGAGLAMRENMVATLEEHPMASRTLR